MGEGKALKAPPCSHLRSLLVTPMYLPSVHLLEESVQVIRSVKDVAQRTDCERGNRSEDVTIETTQHIVYTYCTWRSHGKAQYLKERKVSHPPVEEEVEDTAVWFTTHHWVGTPLHTRVLQHFLGEVEEMEDRQTDRQMEDRQMNRGAEGDKKMEGRLHRQIKEKQLRQPNRLRDRQTAESAADL